MVSLNIQLPEHFWEGETRDGYYVSPEMKKVWAVELDLLNEFMRVCKKHHITWYADAGTMLGAVRHKGFIPWDDDIDLMMFRSEYERFCTIAPSELKHPYFFQNCRTEPLSGRFQSKIRNSNTTAILTSGFDSNLPFNQGISISIFPIDDVPEDEIERKNFIGSLMNIRNHMLKCRHNYLYHKKNANFLIECKHWCAHLLCKYSIRRWNYKHYIREFEKKVIKYEGSNSKYVSKLVLMHGEKRIWERRWFDSYQNMPFEMFEIPVVSGYDELLKKFYGNWHEFVVGTATHGGTFFDVDKPYTEYI